MRKLFLKNLIILQGLNLIIKPIWLLLIDRIAQNSLGSAYGEYNLQLNTCLVFSIVLDIGIQNFNNTQVAANSNFFKQNIKTFISLKFLLSLIYFGVIMLIGSAKSDEYFLLSILALNQIISSLTLYLRSNINGLHHFFIDSLLSISDKFFAIIICIIFYYLKMIDIYYFVIAQTFSSFLTFIIAAAYNLKFYRKIKILKNTQNPKILELFKKSLLYALLFMLMGLYTRADVMMMDWLLPKSLAIENSSIYAHSFRLLDAACMFAMLFSSLLLPIFARQIAENENVKPLAELSAKVLLLISIAVAIGANLYKDGLMQGLYEFNDIEGVIASSKVFGNIMICFIPMCMIYVFGTLLTAKGDIKYMNYIAITSLIVNIVLNYYLIPLYKSYGASISQIITQCIFSVFCIIRCFYLFKFKLQIKTILKFVIFISSLFGVYFIVKVFNSLWINLGLFSLGALFLVLLLKFFDVYKLKEYFQNRTQ